MPPPIMYLNDAVENLHKAIHDKGSHPRYHDQKLFELKRDWPVLWNAIDEVLCAIVDDE
jgi:hypothetical protein